MIWTLPTNLNEVYLALSVERIGPASNHLVVSLLDGSTNQVEIRMAGADGSTLQVTRNGTELGSVAAVFLLNSWKWLSVRVVIHDTAGIVEVRDGAGNVLLNLTGIDTKNTANTYVNNVMLYGGGSTRVWDDVFIMNTTGDTFNGHLTERAIRMVFPTADGSTLDWAPTGAAARWDCVDEQAPDEGTTYLSTATPGSVNLSALGNLTGNETGIEALILQHRSRKDDVGARSMRGIIRTGASNYEGQTKWLTSGYAHIADLWEQNPGTALAWTISDVDGLEGGVELVA